MRSNIHCDISYCNCSVTSLSINTTHVFDTDQAQEQISHVITLQKFICQERMNVQQLRTVIGEYMYRMKEMDEGFAVTFTKRFKIIYCITSERFRFYDT
jgi:hypothetical protein